MKKVIENKKILIGGLIILVLVGIVIGAIFLFGDDENDKISDKETSNNYVAYVKINPLIKIEYTVVCKNDTCSDPVVTLYELISSDAKDIYDSVDLIGSNNNLFDVLNLISETAKDKNIEFESVEIYSNWENLNNYINKFNKDEYTWSYIINIMDKESLEDITDSLVENKVLYNVVFDTDGGNEIESETIEKGTLIKQPTEPTKKGYKFIEWQLNGKRFDFNTEITSDITLKAKWEKIETPTNNQNNNNSNNEDKIIEKTIKTDIISKDNLGNGYKTEILDFKGITVTIKGKKSVVDKVTENDLNLYVDLKGLTLGEHYVDVKTKNKSDGLTYSFNPSKLKIDILNVSNEETSNTEENDNTDNSTNEQTKNAINLNDNVKYSIGSLSCGAFVYIDPVCKNKTVGELKTLFPDYDEETLNSWAGGMEDSKVFTLFGDAHMLLDVFPACKVDIPSDIQAKVKSLKKRGIIYSVSNTEVDASYISFEEQTYYEYKDDMSLSSYGLYNTSACGGGYSYDETLTESVCSEYNLSCDRW